MSEDVEKRLEQGETYPETDDVDSLLERVAETRTRSAAFREAFRSTAARLRSDAVAIETIFDEVAPPDGAERRSLPRRRLQFDGGSPTCKVRGEIDESSGGIGVLGRNTVANPNTTTYGVRGEVDSSDGYGLATPDGLVVDGALAGSIVKNVPIENLVGKNLTVDSTRLTYSRSTLPALSDVGTDPGGTQSALATRTTEERWGDVRVVGGDGHGQNVGNDPLYLGAVTTFTGEVVFVPYASDVVGIYDPTTDTFNTGAAHNRTASKAFSGGALTASGEVVLVPYDSDVVGIYDPATDTYTDGPQIGIDQGFLGAALAPNGDVVFAPHASSEVFFYDPVNNTVSQGASHGETLPAFAGASLAPTGEVVFAPYASGSVGIYDRGTDTYTSGVNHNQTAPAYVGSSVAPTGEVVFVPRDASDIMAYDPQADTFTLDAHNEGTTSAFWGGSVAPTGEVVLSPDDAGAVGLYDASGTGYRSGPTVGQGSDVPYTGGALVPSGDVVLAPGTAEAPHLVETNYDPGTHPLVNN